MSKLFSRLEAWFAAPETNAAGRMGLYRILYGVWLFWLLTGVDFRAMGLRPSPPWAAIGVIKFLNLTPLMQHPQELAYGLGIILGFAVITLTFGLATRLSTLLVFVCSIILFTWDSSFGKVIDKYVLMGVIVPLWMVFSRWGETYSVDALIRKARGLPATLASDSSWEYIWPQRAVIIFTAVLYLSAGLTKTIAGTWLYNPYVVLDKLMGNLALDYMTAPLHFNDYLYRIVINAPLFFMLGQYVSLAFEMGFPLALVNSRFRTLLFSAAAIFHTITILVMDIGFAPMIIVLAIVVDWQAYYDKVWPFSRLARLKSLNLSTTHLIMIIAAIVFLSIGSSFFITSHTLSAELYKSLPEQKMVWLVVAPFALFAIFRSVIGIFADLRTRFTAAAG